MKTFAVIPTKYYPPTLEKYMWFLRTDMNIQNIYILDNGVNTSKVKNRKEIWLDCENFTIYEMWNIAWNFIKHENPNEEINILFLNDDIEFDRNLVPSMITALRSSDELAIVYPDHRTRVFLISEPAIEYTDTTAGAGGMTGYCFMIKGELDIPGIDENLKLYWGDDDLVKQVLARGYKIGRVNGVPILHVGSYSINQMDASERRNLMEADRAYFNQKYKDNRSPVI